MQMPYGMLEKQEKKLLYFIKRKKLKINNYYNDEKKTSSLRFSSILLKFLDDRNNLDITLKTDGFSVSCSHHMWLFRRDVWSKINTILEKI